MKISKLIDRAKANDHDALKTKYETHFPILKDVCFKITKADDDTINDIVQDAFVIAFGSLDKLKDPSKFGSWASVIVKNLSIRHLQKAQKDGRHTHRQACSSTFRSTAKPTNDMSPASLFHTSATHISRPRAMGCDFRRGTAIQHHAKLGHLF